MAPPIRPAISLVIPVYNRPGMIAEGLAALAPSLPHLHEVLVVDDGSTDGRTPEAVEAAITALGAALGPEGARIRLIRQANGGPGAARNTGAQKATGEWLAFMDSDDFWLPWSGAALAAAIAAHPDAAALFTAARAFRDPAETVGWTADPPVTKSYPDFFALSRVRPRVVRTGGGYFAMRRDVFLASGGFEPSLKGSEDIDLYYRTGRAGRFIALESPVMVARRTDLDDSLTLNMKALSEGLTYLMEGRANGRYADVPREDLDRSLAEILAFWIHALFWGGWGREGYDLLLRQGGFGIMQRHGHGRAAWKLLFIPVLSVLRPKNHRFRWRPSPKAA